LDAIVERYKKEHISENLSLTEPAKRRMGSMQRGVALGASDYNAYAAFRSRPGPVIVKRVDTSKKDWLFKKGSKSNRWKPMLFTLNHSEQHLFMHENEKRAKPKGMIDLGYATVMPVHPSLFGKPHCFQVVVRAFNETQFHYLSADTEELKREWMTVLSRCCGPKTISRGSAREGHISSHDQRYRVKQLRSIQLTVVEARRLPKHCQPFCRVVLDDMKVARTQTKAPNRETVKDSCEVIWDEDFKFDDLPDGLTTVSVAIYMKNKRLKDTHIGSVDIPLNKLPNLAEKDEWYPLGGSKGQGRSGPSIRIKVKFTHEVIMDVSSYDPLKELLLSTDLLALKALESVCKDSVRRELAATLVRIFRKENQAVQLLRTVASQEVEKEGELGTMFRGNTLATLLMDQFMSMVAVPYRQATLRDAVQYVIQLDQSCELDPSLISQHTLNAGENLDRLITVLERVLKAVYKSLDNCPIPLRYLFFCLQKAATEKWPDKPEARTRIVSAFLFLRLLGPALLKPKMFNLTSEQPSDIANRTLKLATKSLQSLANLSSFTGLKEPYMAQVNPFIERNQEKMVAFIDELSSVPHCPVTDDDISSIDLARELATVHHLCVSHQEQLDKLSQEQPHVKRLTAVALMLTKEEESLTASDDS
jgi:Ras GTPase-activating protein 1